MIVTSGGTLIRRTMISSVRNVEYQKVHAKLENHVPMKTKYTPKMRLGKIRPRRCSGPKQWLLMMEGKHHEKKDRVTRQQWKKEAKWIALSELSY